MTGLGGAARFVVLHARAHRLLLAAALLTVLLTRAVLATLTACSGAIGDAALRHSLGDPRNAADTALIVKAAADTAVRDGARRTFGGLPVTVRTLMRSGPYALLRSLQPRALPAAVRSGADLGLLTVAGVAYWQLGRQTSGAVTGDGSGTLRVDPLLVAAPAMALLAGTVLTLRLLPPVARLRGVTGAHGTVPAALRPAGQQPDGAK